MNELKRHLIYERYIDTLLKNQNNTNINSLQDLYTSKDYENILKRVLNLVNIHPQASTTEIRNILYNESNIKAAIYDVIYKLDLAPGLIIDYGTKKNRDTIICGMKEEVLLQDNILIPHELPMEEDTIFDLASTSKLFTAIAILKLQELQLIDIFDPITKYVPEFTYLNEVSIYDLLKFRIMIVTDKRIDAVSTKEEAEAILFTAHPQTNQIFNNGYTDIGAMVLKYVVERASNMSFNEFINSIIINPIGMSDTYLNVPESKIPRVCNENYSITINSEGSPFVRVNNIPGTVHDKKSIAIGHDLGNAPGHAGYFSTKDDLIKLANALMDEQIISKESLYSMSETATGFIEEEGSTRFYGSLVYLKQLDPHYLSVNHALSGRSFMSPGFAGTTLIIDPINELSIFIGAPRLHNRIYSIHPAMQKYTMVNGFGKEYFILPNGDKKTISMSFTKEKENIVKPAVQLALQYKLLEELKPRSNELHLVRELN